jgi:predicted RNA-binding protein with PUA-like domain
MKYYLLKTEPDCWSWSQQCAKGVEPWDGVRNFQAQKFMKEMVIGDLAFFYHTGGERRIMGIVRICREAYPDTTDETGRFTRVDVDTVCAFQNPVSLAQIKADPRFDDFILVKQARLSVMPVPEPLWTTLCHWGGVVPEELRS